MSTAYEAIARIQNHLPHGDHFVGQLERVIAAAKPELGKVAFRERAEIGLEVFKTALDDSRAKLAIARDDLPIIARAADKLVAAKKALTDADMLIATGTLDAKEAVKRVDARVAAAAAVQYWMVQGKIAPSRGLGAVNGAINHRLVRAMRECIGSCEALRSAETPAGDEYTSAADRLAAVQEKFLASPEVWNILAICACAQIAAYREVFPTYARKNRKPPTADEIIARFNRVFGALEAEAQRLAANAQAAARRAEPRGSQL